MSKLTDPKWWAGQTPEQQARRAAAKQGLAQVRADMRRNTEQVRDDLAVEKDRARGERVTRRARDAERAAQRKAEGAARRRAILDDREGRTLGGWGRRRK